MYSAFKLNEQGDSIQRWYSPSPTWKQSVVPCLFLTVASWPPYRFLRRQMRWSGFPFSLRIFHSLLWSTQLKALAVNKAEVDVFLEFSWLSIGPVDVGSLISGSSAFSKSNLHIWKFSVYILMKPRLPCYYNIGLIVVPGLPRWLSGKEPTSQYRRCRFDCWVRKISRRRKWQPTPIFLHRKSDGLRNLEGYSTWVCKESDITEQLNNNSRS